MREEKHRETVPFWQEHVRDGLCIPDLPAVGDRMKEG